MRCFVATLLMALLAVSGRAEAVPLQLAHQGRLLDAEQAPMEGAHDLTFRLYDAPLDGSLLWEETVTESFTAGFYSTVLGADATNFPLDDGLFATPPLYLELIVDDGEPLLPRQEINSVPFALRAGTAENVEGGYVDVTEVSIGGDLVIDPNGAWVGPTPSVAWSDLSGVPTGLLDGQDADTLAALSCADEGIARFDLTTGLWVCGTDAVLTSGDVLGFVSGATLAVGAGSSMSGSTLATLADLTWSSLAGVPPDLSDGDADTLAGLSCIDGGVAKHNLGTGLWDCGTDLVLTSSAVLTMVDGATLDLGIGSTVNGVTIATVADLDWSLLSSVPVGFLDGDDADTLGALGPTCAEGDRAAWDSGASAWVCASEQVGLGRLDTSVATTGQVLTFDGVNLGWEDPATPNGVPCTLGTADPDFSATSLDCGSQTIVMRTWERFTEVSAGSQFACGLSLAGAIRCWGDDQWGQASPPSQSNFGQVSAGTGHACAVDNSGAIQCWGLDSSGQATAPAGVFTQVSAGSTHSCAVRSDQALQCWGANDYGASTPPSGAYVAVSVGYYFACAINAAGSIDCWGKNDSGQAASMTGSFVAVSAGGANTCAINSAGLLVCWGDSSYGLTTPPGGQFAEVACGSQNICAIAIDGTATCWGTTGPNSANGSPAGLFADVAVGNGFACGTSQSHGALGCWGVDNYGQSSPP